MRVDDEGGAAGKSFPPPLIGECAQGMSKLGVVVPTGFEPVFEPDYNFALILQRLRTFYSSQKGARLKHEGLRNTLDEARSCPIYVAVSQNASS